MEIINIEVRTFEAMMAGFETFAERVDALCRANGEKMMQDWLDNEDVCRMFDLSKRTLQTYRDNGTLPYTRIGNKMFYRPADVERAIGKLNNRKLCRKS